MPQISIIVPVYNVEKYIEKCLKSIQNQTFEDFECILVDDGSPDRSIEIAKSVVGMDRRFVFLHKKNGGASSARNLGMQNSSGKYICFIDADDFIKEAYLEKLHKDITERDTDLVIHGSLNFYKGEVLDDVEKEEELTFDTFNSLLEYKDNLSMAGPTSKILKGDIIRDNQLFFNEKIHNNEDLLFFIDYVAYITKSTYINRNQRNYYYVYHEDSYSRRYFSTKDWLEVRDLMMDKLSKLYSAKGVNPKAVYSISHVSKLVLHSIVACLKKPNGENIYYLKRYTQKMSREDIRVVKDLKNLHWKKRLIVNAYIVFYYLVK